MVGISVPVHRLMVAIVWALRGRAAKSSTARVFQGFSPRAICRTGGGSGMRCLDLVWGCCLRARAVVVALTC